MLLRSSAISGTAIAGAAERNRTGLDALHRIVIPFSEDNIKIFSSASMNQPRSHPLRMMAADYDSSSRVPRDPDPRRTFTAHTTHRKGAGKGRKGSHNHHNHPQSLADFILPEMLEDPWIGIYSRLSATVLKRETKHLCEADQIMVQSNVQFIPDAKRPNLD